MTGKFYMFFRDDCDWLEQLHWFIDNYLPADRHKTEHRFVEGCECWERVKLGAKGVYTWDNGMWGTFCFIDIINQSWTSDYQQVFYKPDTITIGELQ